jgi:cytochrome c oxidase cbb3-type subunit 1
MNTLVILLSAFTLSVTALFVFIWAMHKGWLDPDGEGNTTIFAPGEIGRTEDPAASVPDRDRLQQTVNRVEADKHNATDLAIWEEADHSTAPVAFVFLSAAVLWLIIGSLAGLMASFKLHSPDTLAQYAWLSFGRIRTLHLNAVAYGWAPMAGLGLSLWILPRLLKTPLVGARFALLGAMLWNAGLIAGLGSIAAGLQEGMEWLEIPWQVSLLLIVGGALIGLPLIFTLLRRKTSQLYVSVWYMGAALFWFPVLYLVAKIPGLHVGVEQATMNWWFGHNVLGLFYTPIALATIYYFLPKVIGRPVQSYSLSLLGFWALAFFYGQVGGHHLIGGPVPSWLITLSIVQSMMMFVPVIAFTTNQYLTLKGRMAAIRYSPTLRFIAIGGLMYTASSLQGSLEALRSINTITHFTHFTVAHAHLGLYGFVTLTFFGGIYFAMPRIVDREWPYPKLISLHFWLVVIGFAIYIIGLSIGGWLQGLAMLDPAKPFMASVAVTLPYLKARTVGGTLMTLGHLVFATHFAAMILQMGPVRAGQAMIGRLRRNPS